jgi:sialate O-acetylesterase
MLQLAHIFQDGMMLQRNKPFQIWGQSDCDQKIAVTLNGTYLAEFEVGTGNFSIQLPQQSTLFNATLSITDNSDTFVFQNVDFGEVWIAGGQSNMEFPLLHDVHGQDEIALADDEHMRLFNVSKYSFEGEKAEGLKDDSGWDRWINLQSETAPLFSAVGYYFAKKLRKHYKVPVAIIGCNWAEPPH